MNKKLIFAFCIAMLCFGCSKTGCCLYKTSATIYLINETSSVVKSDYPFGYTIGPGETIIHEESEEGEYSKRPTVDTYQPFSSSYLFFYIDESKCEVGLTDIENYENRKEVSPLHFELTFRFTEEKKASAAPCTIPVLD